MSDDTSNFTITKGREWEEGDNRTTVRMYISFSGILSREEIEEKLEDLIGQVLDAY